MIEEIYIEYGSLATPESWEYLDDGGILFHTPNNRTVTWARDTALQFKQEFDTLTLIPPTANAELYLPLNTSIRLSSIVMTQDRWADLWRQIPLLNERN